MSEFQAVKLELVAFFGVSKDALHIYAGLLVFLATALVFRRSLRSLLPLAVTLAAALAGELWDIFDTQTAGDPPQWRGNLRDVVNTSLIPAVLFLLARYTSLLRR